MISEKHSENHSKDISLPLKPIFWEGTAANGFWCLGVLIMSYNTHTHKTDLMMQGHLKGTGDLHRASASLTAVEKRTFHTMCRLQGKLASFTPEHPNIGDHRAAVMINEGRNVV